MNNEDRDLLINDYLDGLLAGEQLRTFERELESDSELREEVAALRELLDQAANLPVGIEPPSDLWRNIESRIEQAERPGNIVRFARRHTAVWGQVRAFAVAASLVLVGGLTYWNYAQPVPRIVANAPAPVEAVAPAQTPAVAAWKQAQQEADAAYATARAGMLDALAKRKESLSPETEAALRETLAVIDNSVHELNLALADDPENPALLHMMVATRDKELNLLEQLVSAPDGV
jgi:hypothetical protein